MTAPTEEGTVEELIARLSECERRIGTMCSEGRGPSMTIPANPNDDDLFIVSTLAAARVTLKQIASRSPVVGAVGGAPTEEQKDAARYRWLRDERSDTAPLITEGWEDAPVLQKGALLDAAIDAAMGGIGVSPTGSPEGEVK